MAKRPRSAADLDLEEPYLQRYRKKARVGGGTFSTVFDCLDLEDQKRLLVIKEYASGVNWEPSRREVMAMLALRNQPHIVQMQEYIPRDMLINKKENRAIIVMEKMDFSLRDLCTERPDLFNQPKDQDGNLNLARVMRQLLLGVQACHDIGVIHRDIKPDTVMALINKNVEPAVVDFKLADFNSCCFSDSQWSTDDMYTSYWYCAPESLRRDKGCGKPADMWSLGCIMAELMLGEPLFCGRGQTTDEQTADQLAQINNFFQVENKDPSQWCGIKSSQTKLAKRIPNGSEQAIELLSRLLFFAPSERITVDEALVHSFIKSVDSIQNV